MPKARFQKQVIMLLLMKKVPQYDANKTRFQGDKPDFRNSK